MSESECKIELKLTLPFLPYACTQFQCNTIRSHEDKHLNMYVHGCAAIGRLQRENAHTYVDIGYKVRSKGELQK